MVSMVSGVCFRNGTLAHILSGCVTVGPSEACGIHPIHFVGLVACTGERSVVHVSWYTNG